MSPGRDAGIHLWPAPLRGARYQWGYNYCAPEMCGDGAVVAYGRSQRTAEPLLFGANRAECAGADALDVARLAVAVAAGLGALTAI